MKSAIFSFFGLFICFFATSAIASNPSIVKKRDIEQISTKHLESTARASEKISAQSEIRQLLQTAFELSAAQTDRGDRYAMIYKAIPENLTAVQIQVRLELLAEALLSLDGSQSEEAGHARVEDIVATANLMALKSVGSNRAAKILSRSLGIGGPLVLSAALIYAMRNQSLVPGASSSWIPTMKALAFLEALFFFVQLANQESFEPFKNAIQARSDIAQKNAHLRHFFDYLAQQASIAIPSSIRRTLMSKGDAVATQKMLCELLLLTPRQARQRIDAGLTREAKQSLSSPSTSNEDRKLLEEAQAEVEALLEHQERRYQ